MEGGGGKLALLVLNLARISNATPKPQKIEEKNKTDASFVRGADWGWGGG